MALVGYSVIVSLFHFPTHNILGRIICSQEEKIRAKLIRRLNVVWWPQALLLFFSTKKDFHLHLLRIGLQCYLDIDKLLSPSIQTSLSWWLAAHIRSWCTCTSYIMDHFSCVAFLSRYFGFLMLYFVCHFSLFLSSRMFVFYTVSCFKILLKK